MAAFAAARAEWGGGSLALVGDGPERSTLEALAADLGIAGSVRFEGSVEPAEVPRWLRAADVACLVSEREGFGLAAIEALACGRPVVVARSVPPPSQSPTASRARSATPPTSRAWPRRWCAQLR